MVPRPMRGRLVMMRRVMTGSRRELLLHQQPAAAVPHDLPVGHPVARADCPVRKMHEASLVGRPMVRMRAPVLRPRGAMMRRRSVMAYAPRVTVAHVDPAVARTCTGHGRERRRWRQRLGFGRGLRRFWHRLLGRRLLRAERRCEHPEREGCAGKDDDTLHDTFP